MYGIFTLPALEISANMRTLLVQLHGQESEEE
jgi:hypothetical protein